MKTISIWQPFATLIVEGCKTVETRTWPAPASVIGQRIGIASTKNILPGQRDQWNDPVFRIHYEMTGMPNYLELPFGYLLGTAVLDAVDVMTEEMMEDVSDTELNFGWWEPGSYAWRLTDPIKLEHPIPIRGQQGIYEWKGKLDGHAQKSEEAGKEPD